MLLYNSNIPSMEKVRSFMALPEGWHFGQGHPPGTTTAKTALKLIEEAALSLIKTDAFPGADGEIQVALYHEGHFIEFVVELDESITFTHELNGVEVSYREGLQLSEATEEINRLGDAIWNMSGLSTPITLTQTLADSQAWLSEIRPTEEAYLYLGSTAPLAQAVQYAPTSEGFIPQLQVTHQFSGQYLILNYQRDTAFVDTPAIPAMIAMGI
jgi:hypothetical protein